MNVFFLLMILDFVLNVTFFGKSSGFKLYQFFLLLRLSFVMKIIRNACGTGLTGNTRSVRKVSSHFEYLENRLRGLDVTWQPVRGDLTVHP